MNRLAAFLGGERAPSVEREQLLKRELPRSVVEHEGIDDMRLALSRAGSPRFVEAISSKPPVVPPKVKPPEPLDFAHATHEQIEAFQAQAREHEEALAEATTYKAFPELADDTYRALITRREPEIVEDCDPGVKLHTRILPQVFDQQEFRETRRHTRSDRTLTEIATIAQLDELSKLCEGELSDLVREQEDLEEHRGEAAQRQREIDELRPPTPDGEEGPALTPEAQEQVEGLEGQRDEALAQAQAIAEAPTPMSTAMQRALKQAAAKGRDAAEAASHTPVFGAGHGEGEPLYVSPEAQLEAAEKWSKGTLRKVAERFGRLDKDFRFQRSTRIEGGADEIVDVQFGDNLKRTLPSELALLADGATEDLFFARYAAQELLEFKTVGEEHAGRGPILIVLDGSGSMGGQRNIFARAITLCLLHIARLEKRDFGCIEFSGGSQLAAWEFLAKDPLDGDQVIEMASHLFKGGTRPIIGVQRAAQIMERAPAFKKADLVLVGDGDAAYGSQDEALRVALTDLGVRLFGIAVGPEMGETSYLHRYCEHVVHVQEFELEGPSTATAQLAQAIT